MASYAIGTLAGAALCVLTPCALWAQHLRVGVGGVAVSNAEITKDRQARGLGFGGSVGLRTGRFYLEARGVTASLQADFSIQQDYAIHQADVTATYLWRPAIGFRVGLGRRFVSPDFAAQEVGFLRVGVVSQTRLTRLAEVHANFAYLPLTEFSGRGNSGPAAEVGLGLRIGKVDQPWEGIVEFAYQRLDRDVNGTSSPLRFSVAHVGLARRL